MLDARAETIELQETLEARREERRRLTERWESMDLEIATLHEERTQIVTTLGEDYYNEANGSEVSNATDSLERSIRTLKRAHLAFGVL